MVHSKCEMWVCPQTIRLKGIRLFRNPIAKKADQVFRSAGIRNPKAGTTRFSTKAASTTLRKTRVSGGSDFTATPIKKKEPPQITERASTRPQSRNPMVLLIPSSFMRPSFRG
jgi:hypothetical protein